jgi:hypothetical protein
MVLNQLAVVLTDKVAMGQYSKDEAQRVAKAILYETPQELLGMVPARV